MSGIAEETILLLQGGGALGAYQGGVVQELCRSNMPIDWVAGISIGAINAAIIAGNPPERRVAKLESFWSRISDSAVPDALTHGFVPRSLSDGASAAWITAFGVPGFFKPRLLPPLFGLPGTPAALSVYDTAPLRETLEEHADFDLINSGRMRLSVGAVNVTSGNFAYFDTTERKIGPEHIMASGALPPGLPPVQIDGEYYWDGGIVSNTPLQYVIEVRETARPATIFQVDLFSARGPMPQTLTDAAEREKDIRFSSRTRLNTDDVLKKQEVGKALARLLDRLPAELRDDPDSRLLREMLVCAHTPVAIMHLIYRAKRFETDAKDYLFSHSAMQEHWTAGCTDVRRSLNHPDWVNRDRNKPGVSVFDLTRGDDA